jgi:hypothetical protein
MVARWLGSEGDAAAFRSGFRNPATARATMPCIPFRNRRGESMKPPGQRFLTIYAGVLTVVFAVTVLSGFARAPKKLSLDELDVQRINVREPDRTGSGSVIAGNEANLAPFSGLYGQEACCTWLCRGKK